MLAILEKARSDINLAISMSRAANNDVDDPRYLKDLGTIILVWTDLGLPTSDDWTLRAPYRIWKPQEPPSPRTHLAARVTSWDLVRRRRASMLACESEGEARIDRAHFDGSGSWDDDGIGHRDAAIGADGERRRNRAERPFRSSHR